MAFAGPTRTSSNPVTAGKDILVYLATGGEEANPTWTLLGGQRSADLTQSADEIDASTKTSGGWGSHIQGLKTWSLDCEFVYMKSDPGMVALTEAFRAGAEVMIKLEYSDKSFQTGWGYITDLSPSAPHDDVATVSCTISGNGEISEIQEASE